MKRSYKYVLSSLLIIFALFVLSGCNSDGSSGSTLKEGITLKDVVDEIDTQIGIQMPGDINDELLVSEYYMDMANVETYAGRASETMTSCDTVIGVKAVPGKLDTVVEGLQRRKEDLIAAYANYLPDQYEKAQAGEIVIHGDYAFLIVIGENAESLQDDMQKAQSIINTYFT